jgi:ATP-binding cassette, subfamily B, bacterial PglK
MNPSGTGAFAVCVRLLQRIGPRRRLQFALVLGLMLASAFAEAISLGAVLPFLGVLVAPEKVFDSSVLASASRALGIMTAQELVLPLTIVFATAALTASALRLLLNRANVGLVYATGGDLSAEIYYRTLSQPYRVHVATNSSDIISGIIQKVGTTTHVLGSVLNFAGAVVLFVAIVVALLLINAAVAVIAAAGFGCSYWLIARVARLRLQRNSALAAHEQGQGVKALQEGLGSIRDVLLDGTQSTYTEIYRRADRPARRANADNAFIGQAPRFVMEAIGMVLIATLAYALSRQPGGIATAVPVLGAMALGAQRLLPALQQLYVSWANMAGNASAVLDVLELLDQPLPPCSASHELAPLDFRDRIEFDAVGFRYSADGPWVIDGLSLVIPKGARVGLVGSTGSGKTTALDLLMFLLEPTRGTILVDGEPIRGVRGRSWQRTIAHVPQSIYLADASVAENIAFGVAPEAIDFARVREAARQAQISDYVESHPENYRARIGERGVRLSGGQRQRIGIARALYKQASVLILDEATSSLDDSTDLAVMDAIDNLRRDLTILIIAHRVTTVRRCNSIVHLERGRIVAQGSYEEITASRLATESAFPKN